MRNSTSRGELSQYRSINPWAIAAFLGGLASPLAVVNEFLLIAPLAGFFLSLIALRQVDRNADITTGIGMAKCGLFLSLLCLVFVPAQIVFRTQRMRGNAIELADQVLKLLQAGRTYEAHHLATRKFVGRDTSRELAEYYAEEPPLQELYKRFIDGDPLKRILELNSEFNFKRLALDASLRDDASDALVAQYRIIPHDHAQTSFEVWVVVQRVVEPDTHTPIWWFRSLHASDPGKKS